VDVTLTGTGATKAWMALMTSAAMAATCETLTDQQAQS
jgi:hypothetical protein